MSRRKAGNSGCSCFPSEDNFRLFIESNLICGWILISIFNCIQCWARQYATYFWGWERQFVGDIHPDEHLPPPLPGDISACTIGSLTVLKYYILTQILEFM